MTPKELDKKLEEAGCAGFVDTDPICGDVCMDGEFLLEHLKLIVSYLEQKQ